MIHLVFALLLSQEKIVVEGRIVNAITNEPLRKAAATLEGKTNYNVVSSGDGKFRFEGIEPGEYQPRVQRQGFLNADEEPSLPVSSGEHVKDIVIKLMPQGIIAGHVVDEDGDPVTDCWVNVERSLQVNGRKIVLDSNSESTNGEGYFFINGLKAGPYHVSATPPNNEQRPDSGPREALVRTQAPLAIQLAPGAAMRDVEIRLRKSAVYRVRGRVTNLSKENGTLELWDEFQRYIARIRDGTFTFENVASGNYALTESTSFVTRPDGTLARPSLFCHVPVTVSDHGVDGVKVELAPGPNITGTIRIDGDAHFEKPPVLTLTATFPLKTITAKEDGTFEWTNLAPKIYFLDYGPPKGFYVKSIQFNHQPLVGMMIDLASGPDATLDIVVAPNAATVSARVEGGKRAQIVIWNDSTSDMSYTGPDGTANFDHLAPGDYKILAWQKVESRLVEIPEFRARFEAQKITLTVGSHENVEVRLIPKSASDAEIAKLQ